MRGSRRARVIIILLALSIGNSSAAQAVDGCPEDLPDAKALKEEQREAFEEARRDLPWLLLAVLGVALGSVVAAILSRQVPVWKKGKPLSNPDENSDGRARQP